MRPFVARFRRVRARFAFDRAYRRARDRFVRSRACAGVRARRRVRARAIERDPAVTVQHFKVTHGLS
jgi:hypothetical protein